jgi:hypothetical protein
MTPRPSLLLTEEILSEPKRILLNFFKLALNNKLEDLRRFMEDEKNKKIVMFYDKVVQAYLHDTPLRTESLY